MATFAIGTGLSIQGPREGFDRLLDVALDARLIGGAELLFALAAFRKHFLAFAGEFLPFGLELGLLVSACVFLRLATDFFGARTGGLERLGGALLRGLDAALRLVL